MRLCRYGISTLLLFKRYFSRILKAALPRVFIHSSKHTELSTNESLLYGGPQLSHQNQMLTANYKALTSNSNCSQQIQIAHSKLQITHSKLQIAHSKFKSPTANSNRPQQIKVAHSRFKLLTANYKLLTPLGVFGYLQSAVQLV